MKKWILIKKISIAGLFITLCLFYPVKTSDACFSADVATDVNVNLPIAELQGLIQQLQDAGSQLVGEAGVQMNQVIDELSGQMQQRIDQIKNAGSQLIQEAFAELNATINNLIIQAKTLLAQVNQMILQDIKCIDYVLAQRINQITDAAYSILDKVDLTLKNAIDRIYVRATMLVDSGTGRIAVVLDSTLQIIAKIIILILCFVMLFWLIRTLYLGKFPKKKILAIGIPVLIILLVGGGMYLLFSAKALGKLIGKEIPIPNWQNSCSNGDTYYNDFMAKKNAGSPDVELMSLGNKALEELNWCLYASISPEVGTETSRKISEIKAILYPPAIPPDPGTLPTNNPCNNGGKPSIHPGWLSNINFAKLKVLSSMTEKNQIHVTVINPELFKLRLNQVSSNRIILNDAVHPLMPVSTQIEKIRPDVIKKLERR